MRCARPERFRRVLHRHRGSLAWHAVLGSFRLPSVLLRTARARRALWAHTQALSGPPYANGVQQENTVPISQSNPACSADLVPFRLPLEQHQKALVSNVVQANSREQGALYRIKHVLIVEEASTPTRAATARSPSAYPVPRGSFQLILGLNRSFHASTAPQERFQQLPAMIQRTIVCSAVKASTLCQMELAQLPRAKTVYPESSRPRSGQTQLRYASRAALASTRLQPATK